MLRLLFGLVLTVEPVKLINDAIGAAISFTDEHGAGALFGDSLGPDDLRKLANSLKFPESISLDDWAYALVVIGAEVEGDEQDIGVVELLQCLECYKNHSDDQHSNGQ